MDKLKDYKLNGYPVTGVWAGPHTRMAIDYNGHAVIGVQASESLADGSAYMILLDEHMQVTVAIVIADSIQPVPGEQEREHEPPKINGTDYESTRANLEELARKLLSQTPETTDDLRAAAVVLSQLADVIDGQSYGYIRRTSCNAIVTGGTNFRDDMIDPDYAEDVR
jgi:hypothetical protein